MRGLPLLVLAVAAFIAGVVVAGGSAERDAVERFATAWVEQDFTAMQAELTEQAASEYSPNELERAYARARQTATTVALAVGDPRGPLDQDGETVMALPVQIDTGSFGRIDAELAVPVADGAVAWRPSVVFPGLEAGDRLERRTRPPKRAPILARDGTPLAEGPVDARTTNGAGGVVAGEIGEPPRERAREMRSQGFPEDAPAGTSGLELAFDGRLAGIPGGKLLAVPEGGGESRVLAEAKPQPGKPVRTTIDLDLQNAAAAALGSSFGGVAALDAENGEIRALAGVALSAPQPPGSTFKIVTTVAALEEGVTEAGEEFEPVSSTTVAGREIPNAHSEVCGGDLTASFAHSCNTVFAPLGAELGGERLLETAERFGFNAPPPLYTDEALAATQPPSSTIPDPIGDELDAAVSAIGQGEVLATPLQLASIAQTIANRGVRSPTSLVKDPTLRNDAAPVEVTTPEIAAQVKDFMVAVVKSGTGSAAALPNAVVAGKTGTAELGTTTGEGGEGEQAVDAWFTSFAPANKPKLAVAVMIVEADGDGGVVAAPIAGEVLAAGL